MGSIQAVGISAELVLHDSPVVKGLASEVLLQAQHSMTIQRPMCELCPGLQLELTMQQSDLGTICIWPGTKTLKKQRPSCILRFWWTYGPGATSESAVSTSNLCKEKFLLKKKPGSLPGCLVVELCSLLYTREPFHTNVHVVKVGKVVEERESEPLWQALLALRLRPLTVKV